MFYLTRSATITLTQPTILYIVGIKWVIPGLINIPLS